VRNVGLRGVLTFFGYWRVEGECEVAMLSVEVGVEEEGEKRERKKMGKKMELNWFSELVD